MSLDWILAALAGWISRSSGRGETLDSGDPDWSTVESLARVHNIRPVLHRIGEDGLFPARLPPASLLGDWEKSYFLNYTFNLELLSRLRTLLGRCEVAGLGVAPIKGPVSIARLYGDPALRIMVDLDLLCRPKDLGALTRILGEMNYQSVGETTPYHHVFADPELAASVELHFDLYDTIDRREEFLDDLWRGREIVAVGDLEIPAPSWESGLVVDLAHLLQHDLTVDLRHLLDFALAGRNAPEGTGEPLAVLLELADLGPEFDLVRRLTTVLFGLSRVSANRPSASSTDPAEEFVEELRATLLAFEERSPARALAGAAVRPGAGGRSRYLSRLLFPARTRLEALAAGRSGGVVTALARHLGQTGRRGWSKLRHQGRIGELGALAAVRRDLYLRRASARRIRPATDCKPATEPQNDADK